MSVYRIVFHGKKACFDRMQWFLIGSKCLRMDRVLYNKSELVVRLY